MGYSLLPIINYLMLFYLILLGDRPNLNLLELPRKCILFYSFKGRITHGYNKEMKASLSPIIFIHLK